MLRKRAKERPKSKAGRETLISMCASKAASRTKSARNREVKVIARCLDHKDPRALLGRRGLPVHRDLRVER
jgi:hypothetical protein